MELVIITIIGLCYGSFINVLIFRLPNKISILNPRSFCPKCNTSIPFYRNIPILSFLLQARKCHQCNNKISIQYPIIEIITAFLWFWLLNECGGVYNSKIIETRSNLNHQRIYAFLKNSIFLVLRKILFRIKTNKTTCKKGLVW